jgi:DNA-binding response OmpR family regulator
MRIHFENNVGGALRAREWWLMHAHRTVSVASGTAKTLAFMKVLVVEDDPLLGDVMRSALERACFEAFRVSSAEDAWVALRERDFDLAIVDIGLPGQDGLEFVREARRHGKPFPILMATARDAPGDRQSALAAGANDYVTKPFQVPDLIGRCRALTKSAGPSPANGAITIGGLTVNFDARQILLPPLARSLTDSEWHVLEYLAQHAGKIVSRKTLATLLDLETDHVEGTVQALRNVLGSAVSIRIIRGLGYRLSATA